MRKIFLKNYDNTDYSIVENSQTMNFDLQNLWSSFYLANDWIRVRRYEEGWVTIWNQLDLKRKKDKNFISYEEKKKYDEAYTKYCLKMGKEIPMLDITEQNYEEVQEKWKKAHKKRLNYIIISVDDLGVVGLEGKDKLTNKDMRDLQEEHDKYLAFSKKYDDLKPFRKKTNYEWQSPDDEDYDSDFFTDEEMVWKRKKF